MSKKYTLEEYEDPGYEPRSFLDRITDRTGVKYALFFAVWIAVIGLGAFVSDRLFGTDSSGHEFGAGLSYIAGFFIARLSWVYRY